MPADAIRTATEADNPALRELERSCPQGARLRLHSERDDYFLRSRLYGNDHTLVAEDRGQGRLIGVMAAALKDVYIAGAVRSAAFFYDLRVHPDYRRSLLGRHMLGVWNAMERWAQESRRAPDLRPGQARQRPHDRHARQALRLPFRGRHGGGQPGGVPPPARARGAGRASPRGA